MAAHERSTRDAAAAAAPDRPHLERREEPHGLAPGAVASPGDAGTRVRRLHGAQRAAGNAAVAGLVAPQRAPVEAAPLGVQRYQAGESGHGGVEVGALEQAGFQPGDAEKVYVGNWMRDLSQLNGGPAMQLLIKILALGEFGHEIDPKELGQYVPSEHLDNPEGGETIEDPEVQKDPKKVDDIYKTLSDSQKAEYDREEALRTEITAASHRSHLPEYIERGKMHVKSRFGESIRTYPKDPDKAKMLFGDGLHAVEDYYSHSNFVEACIATLAQRGDPSIGPLQQKLNQVYLGPHQSMLLPKKGGEIQIQTGTYAASADKWVSRIELLQTELEHGYMAKAFVLGYCRMVGMKGEELGKKIAGVTGGIGGAIGSAIGGIGGAVGGAVKGAGQGFVSGGSAGFEAGEKAGGGGVLGGILGGLGAVGGAIGGAFKGLVGGGVEGAESGAKAGGAVGKGVGEAVGEGAGMSLAVLIGATPVTALLTLFGPELFAIVGAAMVAARTGLLEKLAKSQIKKSGEQSRGDKMTSGPTHSELAKDDPEHPLFGVSEKLAGIADTEIGKAMLQAWAGVAHHTDDPAVPFPTDDAASGGGGGTTSSSSSSSGGGATTPAQDGSGALPTSGPAFNAEVDKRFWDRTHYKVGKRLDPHDAGDRPYVRIWLQIRDEVRAERSGGGSGGAATDVTPDAANGGSSTAIQMDPEVIEGHVETEPEKALDELVDKYVCHPDQTDWWVKPLQDAAKAKT